MNQHPSFDPPPPALREKECPCCGRIWTPTPFDDYLLTSCGCYGTSHDFRYVPCERCGIAHALRCPKPDNVV